MSLNSHEFSYKKVTCSRKVSAIDREGADAFKSNPASSRSRL